MRWASAASVALALWGCEPGSCEKAREAATQQIDAMCANPNFSTTQFCSFCVRRHGYYSIDDACTCRVLNFDADFCLYADPDATVGTSKVRDALIHAADICRDRSARLPYPAHDGGLAGDAGGAR